MNQSNEAGNVENEEKSFFSVIVHSFFIIPFLIAVFCILLFAGIHLLTRENRSAYDYLEDVKTGGLTKRWQGAFELSKILAHPGLYPQDDRFANEMIAAFEQAKHDDNRVRQYLALAMGRTGKKDYVGVLLAGLKEEKEENLPALIYALGMLEDPQAAQALYQYIDHTNPRIRSITTVSLGNIGHPSSIEFLKKKLFDSEANVQWGAALSLAKMGDVSGRDVLRKLLSRDYYVQFEQVDPQEQTQLIISAIEATAKLNDRELLSEVRRLSQADQNMKVRSAALEALQ